MMILQPIYLHLLILAAAGAPLTSAKMVSAQPRVEYLRTVPSVKEFTKPRGLFSKIATLLAGPDDDKPELRRPYATAQDSIGRLLVADPGEHGVHLFDFEKRKYQFIRGPRSRQMQSPIDVACDLNDDIYVSDSERKQIYIFDRKGSFINKIDGNGQEAHLERPTGMALDRQARRLYITDTLRHQLMVFGMDGSLVRVIGKRGKGAGEFNFPTAVTIAAGQIYVVDSMNFRIQAFTPDGQFVNSFGRLGNQSGTLNRPKGIAADTDGNLYVVDALFETVQVFNPLGQLLYYFGSTGSGPGQFQLPSGISIDDRNRIYVADSLNRRVQIFRYRRSGQ